MSVNPGFAGRHLIESTVPKVAKLRTTLDNYGRSEVNIAVDGSISFNNAQLMRDNGAEIFVAGSSSIFKHDEDIATNVRNLRNSIV